MASQSKNAIIWLRRDLQVQDNISISRSIRAGYNIQPVFIFDTDILERFTNKKDRRISFIVRSLILLNEEFKKHGGELLILHGSAKEIIPQFNLPVFSGEDYEPSAIERDKFVGSKTELILSKQHLLLAPDEVLKSDKNPFRVFTPYSKAWHGSLKPEDIHEVKNNLSGKMVNIKAPKGVKEITVSSAKIICEQIGYEFFDDNLWRPENAHKILADFVENKCADYAKKRDVPAIDGTSSISPYLRFGLITPRQAYNVGGKSAIWLKELIWREFYAMMIYHFPESAHQEFQPQYRGLNWSYDKNSFKKWQEGKTGYGIVDAGMRQLLETGWMHNRVRMIVASFLTKDLLIDWRWGEDHFAQHLMDYEQASNVGGWQWASSTGTDAVPYFRVFNPTLQQKRFDPELQYVKKYVPEFGTVKYVPPIVNHASVKSKVLALFKGAKK